MRKKIVIVLASLLLTACAAPVADTPEEPESGADAGPVVETVPPASPELRNMLPGLDVSGLEETMPEADFAAFQAYLPVLTGEETFRWVAGPSYDDWEEAWEPFDADMAAVHDGYWGDAEMENPPGTLTLDRLAVADIVGDEEPELVLLLQDRGYQFLVFHREDGEVYGTSFVYRRFESLQKTGIYLGSGGVSASYYYQLSFHDGRFWGEQLGEKIGDDCVLNGRKVSEAEFDAWYAENMTNDVTWYSPDGAVIPENM